MNDNTLQVLFGISLKQRIIREWQRANEVQAQDYSERDMLCLELISAFGPVTEAGLYKVFALSISSVNDMVKKLIKKGVIQKVDSQGTTRGAIITLTEQGGIVLEKIKAAGAARFGYLFSDLSLDESKLLTKVLIKLDNAATRQVNQLVFGRYSGPSGNTINFLQK